MRISEQIKLIFSNLLIFGSENGWASEWIRYDNKMTVVARNSWLLMRVRAQIINTFRSRMRISLLILEEYKGDFINRRLGLKNSPENFKSTCKIPQQRSCVKIEVQSQLGKGAKFTFLIPVCKTPSQDDSVG